MDKEVHKNVSNVSWAFIFGCAFICLYIILITQWVYEGQRALYNDDLDIYNIMTNPYTSLWNKITDTTSNKTRYVMNIILIVFFKLVGENFERIDILLLCWNIFIALSFYIIIIWCGKNKINNSYKIICLACLSTLLLVSSRFSYYTYSEVLGIMESLALILTVGFAALLIKDNFQFGIKYWIANILYLIVIYVHERYFVLAGVLVLYSLIGTLKTKSYRQLIMSSSIALLIPLFFFGLRFLVLGNRILDGTGGTSILETFSVKLFITQFFYQVLYLMGINPPNNVYLNGIDPRNVPLVLYVLNIMIIIITISILIKYIFYSNQNRINRIQKLLILIATIFCLMIASCVTIRVEMRWVYSSFAILIFSIYYMLTEIHFTNLKRNLLICIGTLSMLINEGFYRVHWTAIYYWGDRELSSSLVEILNSYDKEIDSLTIVSPYAELIWNEDTIRNLGKPYGFNFETINLVENVYEADETGIILFKEKGRLEFSDITDISKKIYNILGWYSDGWLEPDTRLGIINDNNSILKLVIHFPYEIENNDNVEIWINGIFNQSVSKKENEDTTIVEIRDFPKGKVEVDLKSNFSIIENSGRSEDGRLSCVLEQIQLIE